MTANSREGDGRTDFGEGSSGDAHQDTGDDPRACGVRRQYMFSPTVFDSTLESHYLDSLHKAAGPPL